jgi:glycosyltransferase involved in cell wall biosynthesis
VKTIVSVTPIPVERDSRTFKLASSMSRMGYRSIVVEGEASVSLPRDLPFQLLAVSERPADPLRESLGGLVLQSPPDAETTVHAPSVALGTRTSIAPLGDPQDAASPGTSWVDDLAATAPTWLRRYAGPPWRLMLRSRSHYAVARARLLRHATAGQPYAFWFYLRDYVSRCRTVASALPPADLFYLHGQVQFPAVWWRSSFGRTPFVYDAHDLYWVLRHDGRTVTPAEGSMFAVWDTVERICAARARVCVTVGNGVRRHAEARFGRPFMVIRNAHDSRLDASDVPNLRQRLGLSDDAFVLAVSGNYKSGMAVRPMLHAARLLPERVHVVFVGARYEPFEQEAHQFGLDTRVHFVAPVPPTHIVPLIAGADLAPILYWPSSLSVRNALPNGFFHAVAAGVPLLYPIHLPELRDLCAERDLGWQVDPENPASLVTKIRFALDRPEELERHRTRVVEAREDLSWLREERTLAEVLSYALDGQRDR